MSATSGSGEAGGGGAADRLARLAEAQSRLRALLASERAVAARLRADVDLLTARLCGPPSTRPGLTRRRMLALTGAGVAGGAALALRQPSAVAAAVTAPFRPRAADVEPSDALDGGNATKSAVDATALTGPTLYVPAPTGDAPTDTANILATLKHAAPGTTVVFLGSATAVYSIDQELPIPRGTRITGLGPTSESAPGGATMPTLQQAAGTDLVCIAASANFLDGLYGPNNPGQYPTYDDLYADGTASQMVDSAIEVDHLAFDGQNGGTGTGNTSGHGMVMFTYGANIHDCYFINVAQTGIYLADINYLGQSATNENHENRIQDNVIVNPGWWGIRVDNDPEGFGGATDGHILNNVVRSPSKQQSVTGPTIDASSNEPFEAIYMANAAGWWIKNNHLVACPGNAVYTNTTGGIHLDDNTVDGFGCHPQPHKTYVGFNITTAGQTKLHPGRIIGNLVAAYEGANPFDPSLYAVPSVTYQYYKVSMQTNPGRLVQPTYDAYPTQANNVAHQASQVPAPISGAAIPNTAYVTVPQGAASGVRAGMGIADTAGVIKAGTTVTSVTPGTGEEPDTIYLSSNASRQVVDDTIRFVGPTSVAWTYANALAAANMWVHRANEMVTGTIGPEPLVQITVDPNKTAPTITIYDTTDYAGGLYVSSNPRPTAGEILVAAAASGTAAWEAVTSTAPLDGSAGGVLTGSFPGPAFAPGRTAVLTASGTYQVPAWAGRLRITGVGGGGGGGGGVGGTAGQVGGAGGAAGTTVCQFVDVSPGSTLTVSVGAGGPGGLGAVSGEGQDGTSGGTTTIQGAGVDVAAGGGAGGSGAAAGSTPVPGGAYGAAQGSTAQVVTAATGGSSGTAGGDPFDLSPGGAGGGGSVSGGSGGSGGGAGASTSGGAAGVPGGAPGSTGAAGAPATSPGGPGGGGGAGAGAAGGDGGTGAGGMVVIEVVG